MSLKRYRKNCPAVITAGEEEMKNDDQSRTRKIKIKMKAFGNKLRRRNLAYDVLDSLMVKYFKRVTEIRNAGLFYKHTSIKKIRKEENKTSCYNNFLFSI